MTRSRQRVRPGIMAGLIAIAAVSCRPSAPPAPAHPDVVMIVVASLRADHVGVDGYAKPTTPHLDALARAGVRFADARAASSWALPSVASILTGLYPAAHGADRPAAVLADGVASMPDAFRAAGYTTAAISADPCFVTPAQGLARGFDEFEVTHGAATTDALHGDVTPTDPFLRGFAAVSTADTVTARALDWLARRERAEGSTSKSYFLYLHYFDPHAGYFPPPEYARRFGIAPDAPLAGDAQWTMLHAATPPAAADVATLIALYDAEIAYTDAAIGTLLDALRGRGRPTLIVVVGAHGEELNDHGGLLHGNTLYDEVLRVPFIVAGPGVALGQVRNDAVSLVSVWPTVAEAAGLPPPPAIDGIPLGVRAGAAPPKAQNVFADLEPRWIGVEPRHRRAVVADRWKLVTPPAPPFPSLFDLANDRLEQIGTPPAVTTRQELLEVLLKVHARAARAARARHPPGSLPP